MDLTHVRCVCKLLPKCAWLPLFPSSQPPRPTPVTVNVWSLLPRLSHQLKIRNEGLMAAVPSAGFACIRNKASGSVGGGQEVGDD